MFASLMERFRQRPELGRPIRPEQVLGDIVAGVLVNTLALDFQRVGDLFWVSDPKDHMRYLLKFQAMKGMTFSACWGVSVDFVPTLGGGKLKLKRTPKSAAFDLCIDPIDLSGQIPDWCSFYSNDRDYHVKRAASAAVRAARLDWSKITTLSDVADTFERRSRMVFKRFSLENYVQTDLAWGLVLIALGRTDEGNRHLDAFCRQFAIAPEAAILTKAKREAAAIAGRMT
ncbi:MAG: hypothetical protein EOQ50_31960 [Mesorhizobium sp.]|uniref:hypothetical protein n=1 Tax=Mesorhizobium sp. TaxID=1871066 RepID=UPI000FE64F68|nr:hypothetical protein [Mesorhizobium sp.]RWB66785.1 MAG: hypothetical protein EOQ50_31960 [Mesorhizobium sp.]